MSLTIDQRSLNALKLAAGAARWTQLSDGVFLIPSQSDPSQRYMATPTYCDCPDAQHHPERPCKHQLAAAIVTVMLTPPARPYQITDADVDRIFARA